MSDDGKALPTETHSAEVADFLDQLKRMPARPGGGRGRLIFALDATASREPTWDRACRIQGEMFEATAALGGLEIQLVFYRG
ncbi:MAG TPA: VWA domain-containing protein, partial [Stellaceae bacterium]|nr:VWA domain-containing protein [Stellaceae bacterium]